jgi:hypothetical protein
MKFKDQSIQPKGFLAVILNDSSQVLQVRSSLYSVGVEI